MTGGGSDAPARFAAAAARLGIRISPVTHPAGTRTAGDAADAIGCAVGQIVKSLVFMATTDDRSWPVLALTAGDRQVDPPALAAVVGADSVRIATPDEVRAATGFAIGGTPPFGHPEPVTTVLDPHLAEHDEVWAAAGTPRDVVALTPSALRRAGAREVEDFTRPG